MPESEDGSYGAMTVTNYTVMLDLDPEAEYLARRLFPGAEIKERGREGKTIIEVQSSLDNVRLLRMMAAEFPLRVRDPNGRWPALVGQVDERAEAERTILTLGRREPPKAHFTGTLRPFQEEGLDWMLRMDGRCLLADEMGLGKTVQTLAFLAASWQTAFPCVIVAPLVTLVHWEREINTFLRGAVPVRGSASRLQATMDEALGEAGAAPTAVRIRKTKGDLPSADIYILNYDIAKARADQLAAFHPATVVFDEAQHLRSSDTQKYAGCKKIAQSARHRIGLSGTPFYNHGTEILPIADAIRPGCMPSWSDFKAQYCTWDEKTTKQNAWPALSALLRRRLMLRRRKADVLDDLPDKTRTVEHIQIDDAVYDRLLAELSARVEDARAQIDEAKQFGLTDQERTGVLELRGRMSALRAEERSAAGMAKAPYVARYVRQMLEDNPDEKFVVFCHHRAVHDALVHGLAEYGIAHVVGGQSDKARQRAIDRFQREDARLAVCGLRAGGVGISLTAARYVIFAELDWSPAVHRQAEDRLHRIGQKNAVFAHYLVGSGTYDDKIADVVAGKAAELAGILADKKEDATSTALASAEFADRIAARFKGRTAGSIMRSSAGLLATDDDDDEDDPGDENDTGGAPDG